MHKLTQNTLKSQLRRRLYIDSRQKINKLDENLNLQMTGWCASMLNLQAATEQNKGYLCQMQLWWCS